jgi:putative FmdB family regulatory protein
MPTYDYRCNNCKARFNLFFSYADYGRVAISCPKCGSAQVRRRIGRIRIAKSEERRLDDMVNPSHLDGLENDPKALGRLMRKMGAELGEDAGPEFDEVVSRLESGQDPEEIERDLPNLVEGLTDFDGFED